MSKEIVNGRKRLTIWLDCDVMAEIETQRKRKPYERDTKSQLVRRYIMRGLSSDAGDYMRDKIEQQTQHKE